MFCRAPDVWLWPLHATGPLHATEPLHATGPRERDVGVGGEARIACRAPWHVRATSEKVTSACLTERRVVCTTMGLPSLALPLTGLQAYPVGGALTRMLFPDGSLPAMYMRPVCSSLAVNSDMLREAVWQGGCGASAHMAWITS